MRTGTRGRRTRESSIGLEKKEEGKGKEREERPNLTLEERERSRPRLNNCQTGTTVADWCDQQNECESALSLIINNPPDT